MPARGWGSIKCALGREEHWRKADSGYREEKEGGKGGASEAEGRMANGGWGEEEGARAMGALKTQDGDTTVARNMEENNVCGLWGG